ncbi:phage regulatory CII family protein [Rhizobium sp. RU36D]|uniref:phage regulatory CII family protein n=1 Tax=Rhizobium sp. RU36D TaxID=1907415 RepID=UPI0009D8F4FF|nr:phage regulatory CII family protein [Rhizobium sp. RU36D]SMD18581.1 hypothetical protein SAMN05880593_13538 [Rhizobium sp. RU36D]
MRQISEKQSAELKAVTRRGLDLAGGGGIACHSTRVNEGQLSKYASNGADNAMAFVPVDVAIELDMLAGSPVIVAHMAALLGFKLVPVRGADAGDGDALSHADALDVANETSDVVRVVTQVLASGHVDAAARQKITREADEAIRALKSLVSKVGAA